MWKGSKGQHPPATAAWAPGERSSSDPERQQCTFFSRNATQSSSADPRDLHQLTLELSISRKGDTFWLSRLRIMGMSRASLVSKDRRRRRPPSVHRRLKHARFPAQICTLAHVLKYIDILLMTPCEALVEAARTNEFEWMWRLMDQVESTVLKEAFVAAAREDHLEVVRTLRLEFRSSRTGRREYEAESSSRTQLSLRLELDTWRLSSICSRTSQSATLAFAGAFWTKERPMDISGWSNSEQS